MSAGSHVSPMLKLSAVQCDHKTITTRGCCCFPRLKLGAVQCDQNATTKRGCCCFPMLKLGAVQCDQNTVTKRSCCCFSMFNLCAVQCDQNTTTKRGCCCFPMLKLGAVVVQCEPRCCLGWYGSEGHAAGKSAQQQAGRSSADGRLRPCLGARCVLPQRRCR